jgi:hypothetical protein
MKEQGIRIATRISAAWLILACCREGTGAQGLAASGLQPTFIVSRGETIVASAVATEPPYDADRSGRRDATAAIQKALDDVAAARGGVVFLPAGRYRMDSGLTLPYATTLMGECVKDPADNIGKGTVLAAQGNGHSAAGPPLLDAAGTETGLINLTVWYPQQKPGQIEAYAPTVSGDGSLTIRNLTLCNSYDGIYLKSANACVFENIRGTVLHRGIVAPESTEMSWMHDVHFANEWWRRAASAFAAVRWSGAQWGAVNAFTREHLIGLELQRIDGMAIYHYAADDAATAVLMGKNPKFPELVFGFGGMVADFQGAREEEGWAPWYYFMHYANLDNVPEAGGKRYVFGGQPKARVTTAGSFIDVALPPYAAAGNGTTDDTGAIERALADAGRRGGGTVYLRQGEYKITAPLVVPAGVELRGPLGAGKAREGRETCTLAVYCGQDTIHPATDPAAITLMNAAGVRGFTVAHPRQEYDAHRLHPFPYAIRGQGGDLWIVDMMLLNSFNGIDLASDKCDRHLVRGVWGTTFCHGLTVGGESIGGKLERVSFSCGPWTEARERLGGKITAAGTAAIRDCILQTNMAFSFGDCAGETAWGLFAFEPCVHFHFYADKGRGCRDANFWQSLHDMARRSNLLAESGGNINLFGYFGTGTGEQTYNWLEVGPSFQGPLNIYGKTILREFQNHPLRFSQKQARFYDEVSLTAGRRAASGGTLAGSSPANAVDRDCRTLWQAAAGSDLDVDLGQPRWINRFGIESAGWVMPQDRNTLEAELWAGDDGRHYRKAAVLETGGAAWADMPFAPLQARYVRLRVTKPGADGIIRVASFDVFEDGREAFKRGPRRPGDRPAAAESR